MEIILKWKLYILAGLVLIILGSFGAYSALYTNESAEPGVHTPASDTLDTLASSSIASSTPEGAADLTESPTLTTDTTSTVTGPTTTPPPPPSPTESSAPQQLDISYQDTILTGHNQTRIAKGLTPLTWSASLAASAQSWADTLSTRDCALEHSNTPYGENLYYSWTTGTLTLSPEEAVAWWLAEEQYYDYPSNTCQAGQQCGHYTQMIWADTRSVGCGVSTCNTNARHTQMWVCHYDPIGNILGERPY